ncbi:MAG: polyprenyl synthetase family protein [Pirellulaceae bacterium]|jgi:geranylgeranyl diphosphate synthase type II|nr:polyprenyl synthetase family protein [Pirellulaceae bacterium]
MVEISAITFDAYVAETRAEIEAALLRWTEFNGDCPNKLRDAIRYSLLAPCKRLRPLLVLMSAEACGYDRGQAMPAACAVEMIHTYSLIHDDLPAMDDDDLRRGQPTCHAQFDEATAILAGDALLTRAFEIMAIEISPAKVAACCCVELASAAGASGMVAGQVDDLAGETGSGGLAELEAIHRRKTGAMFRVSLRLGAIVAQAGPEQLQRLDTYGQKLGLAFQIIDDLLDVHGSETAMGKRIGKDSNRGKLTFPRLLGLEASQTRARQLVDDACAELKGFGSRAAHLESLARYVVERNH